MVMGLDGLRELVMHREAWHAVVHGVTKSRAWLSDWNEPTITGLPEIKIKNSESYFWFKGIYVEERPGMLRFMGLQRVGHDWATELNWTEEPKKIDELITKEGKASQEFDSLAAWVT